MQLEVQEDLFAARLDLAAQIHAAYREELEPDLVEADSIADGLDKRPGSVGRRQVERDDEAGIGV